MDAVELQRARLLAAAIHTVEHEGLTGVTVAKLIGVAHVSRTTFYELFSGTEDCLHAALTRTFSDAADGVRDAYQSEQDPLAGLRGAVGAMLEQADDNPGAARLCLLEALAGGPRMLKTRAQTMEQAARAIHLALGDPEPRRRSAPLTARAAVGAVAELLHTELLREKRRPLIELQGTLMAIIVLPYLGLDAACQELAKRARPSASRSARDLKDPLTDLDFRLTYRTARVLAAAAELPGASNREIAARAGIGDPGQISKLLRRLQGHGLLENNGYGHAQGKQNAWRLTPFGRAVQRATTAP